MQTVFNLALVNDYLSGTSGPKVADLHGVALSTVYRNVHAAGYKTRTLSEHRFGRTINERAFDELTPAACYWLGFLFADGHLFSRKRPTSQGGLEVGLTVGDRKHLENLQIFLGSTHKIGMRKHVLNGKTYYSVRFSVKCEPLYKKLLGYGMVKNSIGRICPDILKYNLDFWRGLIDGDGCLHVRRHNEKLVPLLTFCAPNRRLTEQCADFAGFMAGRPCGYLRPHRGIWYYTIEGRPAIKVISALYGGNPVESLARKQAIANRIMVGLEQHAA